MRLILVDLGHAWGGAQRWALRLSEAWLSHGTVERSLDVISPHAQFSAIGATLKHVSPGRLGLKAAANVLRQQDAHERVIIDA